MKNKICAIVVLMMLSACAHHNTERNYVIKVGGNETEYLKDVGVCPKLHIRRADAKIVQKQGKEPVFEIEAEGYSGYCYYSTVVEKQRAVITPKFKIVRLNNKDITDVHFSYYLETAEGPKEYLGRKTYFAEVSMPVGVKEISYTADIAELTIPNPGIYDLDVYFGLNEDVSELQFKK